MNNFQPATLSEYSQYHNRGAATPYLFAHRYGNPPLPVKATGNPGHALHKCMMQALTGPLLIALPPCLPLSFQDFERRRTARIQDG